MTGNFVTSYDQQIAWYIRERRKECGLSQDDLADRLGCSRGRIAWLESDTPKGAYTPGELQLLVPHLELDAMEIMKTVMESTRYKLETEYTAAYSRRALTRLVQCQMPVGSHVSWPRFAFAPEGDWVLGILDLDQGHMLACWDTPIGAMRWQYEPESPAQFSAMAMGPNRMIAAAVKEVNTDKVLVWSPHHFHVLEGKISSGLTGWLDTLSDQEFTDDEDWRWSWINADSKQAISRLAISPDGRMIATVNDAHGVLRRWQIVGDKWEELQPVLLVKAFGLGDAYGPFPTFQLEFAPNGQLAIMPVFGRLTLLDAISGEITGFLPSLHEHCNFAFVPSSEMLWATETQAGRWEGMTAYDTLIPFEAIRQIVAQPSHILALGDAGQRDDGCAIVVKNLVTGKGVAFEDARELRTHHTARLSPDGTVAAYAVEKDNRVTLQHLDLGVLGVTGEELPLWR